VFVNDRGIRLPAGASVRDAVRVALPDLLPDCESGALGVTDARGLPLHLDDVLAAGAILRAARSTRRAGPAGLADAGV
jgi:hypothetical protein